MEIQTFVLESWMCRICLAKGAHDIFRDHLLPPALRLQQQQQQKTAKVETFQGHQHHSQRPPPPQSANCDAISNSVPIVDALNYFSEFKISSSEIANEPSMLCASCCADLLQCYQFRIKLNEAECLLRRDTLSQATESDYDEQNEDTKTGLTLQMNDIEPFLEDAVQTEPSSLPQEQLPKPPPKIHHAKPRFELTNQVSNILRHVTSSSSNSRTVGGEKRKDLDGPSAVSTTPAKIQRRNSTNAEQPLDNTLVVPKYVFANQIDDRAQVKKILLVEKSVITSPSEHHIPSDRDLDRTENGEIFYCSHCPKAFSSQYHLATHTKTMHLCQHCFSYLPDAMALHRHIRAEHKFYRCPLCSGFSSPYAINLRVHLRKTHSVVLPAHVAVLQEQGNSGE